MEGSRRALIVATYAYDDPGLTRLRAPARDAEALSGVLADPEIGGFEVRSVVNQPAHVVNVEVAPFFANRRPDELLLLHFSCHGVKDDSGELYFATTDTRLDVLEATAVSSAFVNRVMGRTRSTRVVLLLDCCYAGAFARGLTSRGGAGLDLNERLGGRGRAVITASTALQFAFEGGDLAEGDPDSGGPSVFTRALVAGLRSGEADRDLDGMVSLDELYGYVYDEVTTASPHQTPGKWVFGLEGDLYLARRVSPVTVPSDLPRELTESLESPVPWHREGVIAELDRVLHGSHPGRALAARLALERLADDDSRHISEKARDCLAAAPPLPTVRIPTQRQAQEPDQQPEPEPGPEPTTTLPAPPRTPRRPHGLSRRLLAAAVLAVVMLLVAAVTWWPFGGSGAPGGSSYPTLAVTTVLVSQYSDSGAHLVAVDATTGAVVRAFPHVPGRLPTISPDRRWIAYLAGPSLTDPASKEFVPYLMRADGSHRRRLLRDPPDACRYTGRPAWNPNDSDQLVLACQDGSGTESALWRVSLAGTLLTRLGTDPTAASDPTWTGNGTVVYARRPAGPQTPATLWEQPADAPGRPQKVIEGSTGSASDTEPDWSPAGLLFLRSPSAIAVGSLTVLTGHDRVDTPAPGTDVESPTWSPDGKEVAFVVAGGADRDTLWVGPASDPREVSGLTGRLGPPAWGSR